MAKAQINPERTRWLEVLGVSMPLCLSYIPIGLACGILLHAAGLNFIMILLVSVLVFSGGAQFILSRSIRDYLYLTFLLGVTICIVRIKFI